MKKLLYILLLLRIALPTNSIAQQNDLTLSIHSQSAVWSSFNFQDPFLVQPAGRFVPSFLGKYSISEYSAFDFEASANINGSFTTSDFNYQSSNYAFKPYRVWLRYSGEKYEIRAGLQKINFGSAKMFRPLMWFDEMDVRDPLQLTDGVKGILAKYFFENNANIWFWSLYGNHGTKGFELVSTKSNSPEFGGRFESPLGPGEIGLAVHSRTVSTYDNFGDDLFLSENRLGFNGKWDLGIGLWMEGSLYFTEKNELIPEHVSNFNFGMDYTFPLANGLGISLEYFRYDYTKTVVNSSGGFQMGGLMLNYPLGINDQLSAIVFAIPSQNQLLSYISWSKTWDDFAFYTIAFWNPDTFFSIAQVNSSSNLFMGKGIQLMFTHDISKDITKFFHP